MVRQISQFLQSCCYCQTDLDKYPFYLKIQLVFQRKKCEKYHKTSIRKQGKIMASVEENEQICLCSLYFSFQTACLVVVTAAVLNVYSVKWSARSLTALSFAKLVALGTIIITGMTKLAQGKRSQPPLFTENKGKETENIESVSTLETSIFLDDLCHCMASCESRLLVSPGNQTQDSGLWSCRRSRCVDR